MLVYGLEKITTKKMNTCYVTSYFDIGRSQWDKFARTFDDYLIYFKPFLSLFEKSATKDHLLVFLDDRYISKLHDLITAQHSITLIPINESFLYHNLPCWKTIETERHIMNSPEFKLLVGSRIEFPECRYPEYTLINHCKIDFINYAINLNLSSFYYFAWVDFGFFSKSENIPKTLLNLQNFDLSRITYTLINPIDESDNDIYYTLKCAPEKIGGFFFLGNRDTLSQYQKLYHQSLYEFQAKNICDDDQALALYCYFKNPSLFSLEKQKLGWHKVFIHNQSRPKKVISFCLWGNEKKYTVGLLENIKLASLYYPDWVCYVYIHYKSLTDELQKNLEAFSNVKIIVKKEENIRHLRFMLWRLEPILDEDVELFISRDVDTRILPREVLAVRQWVTSSSEKVVHIMRDHPQHYNKILGGMYGIKTEIFRKYDWINLIETFYKVHGETENDQHFLEKFFYNMTSLSQKMIHDEIKLYENENCIPFPIPYEQNYRFVGGYVYEDDSTDAVTQGILKNHLQNYLKNRVSKDEIPFELKLQYITEKIGSISIIHYTKLTSRKVNMMKQLGDHLLDVFLKDKIRWVENYDREKIAFSSHYSSIINRNMSRGEIANMMAHESVFKQILSSSHDDIHLVIEDDCIFKPDFIHHLYTTLILLKDSSWDMCCLGGPVELNTFPARALDKSTLINFESDYLEIFTPSTPAPCTLSAMLYHRRGIQKIIDNDSIKKYQCPSDHAVWLAAMENKVEMKWIQPFITYEGSKTELFSTSFTERGF